MTQAVPAIRLDPADPSPLRIDPALVHRMLVGFLRREAAVSGHSRLVLGLSGGIDSAVVAALAAEAFGPASVTALFTPYRTSAPASAEHARLVAETFGLGLEVVPVTPQIDAFLAANGGEIHRVRLGNKLARERKSIEYDRSWPDALVLGTSNKTEILLGYGTQFGDLACALNPVGDLYKTQLRQLAAHLGVPAGVIDKPPSADLWAGQTDEDELGLSYAQADLILFHLVDRRIPPAELVSAGFPERVVRRIGELIRRYQYKRVMPVIAKLGPRTIGQDFLYPRDWDAD